MNPSHLISKFLYRSALVCILLGMLTGCGSAITAEEALVAARLFVNALQLLQDASKLYNSYVSDAVISAKEQLTVIEDNPEAKVDLPRVAVEWEQNWQKVNNQMAELEKRFQEVETASNRYWDTLEKVTNQINDPELREQERKKNQDAKKKWDEAYQNAKKQIDSAKTLRDKGNDLKNMMIAAALRRQLAEYTATLDLIAKEAENLLNSLDILIQQGRAIVNLNS